MYIAISDNKTHKTMTAQCTQCQATIKNIVIIDGKPYGTTCAEHILGTRLPEGFKGDYNSYKRERQEAHEKSVAEFEKRKEITRKHWGDMIILNRAMWNARDKFNDWEANFVHSIARQCNLEVLYLNPDYMKETMDETYEDENWNVATGGSTKTYFYHEPKWLDDLSDKQKDILDRIAS